MSHLPICLGKLQWWPLEQFVIRQWNAAHTPLTPYHVAKFCSQFMFMGESDSGGKTYALYKHCVSRRYLNLSVVCATPHRYETDHYRPITANEAISHVDELLDYPEKVWHRTLS